MIILKKKIHKGSFYLMNRLIIVFFNSVKINVLDNSIDSYLKYDSTCMQVGLKW